MDTMFNNDLVSPISSNGNLSSTEALKSMLNKRKLVDGAMSSEGQVLEENGNDSTKRLCTTDKSQSEQKR